MTDQRRDINWEKVKANLKQTEAALVSSSSLSPEKLNTLLRTRAELLAGRQKFAVRSKGEFPCLIFHLGKEKYAIELNVVEATTIPERISPVPGWNTTLAGVFNWRGDILSVMDLRSFLGMNRDNDAEQKKFVLILWDQKLRLGIQVDFAEKMQSISKENLNLDVKKINVPMKYVKGLTKDGIILLEAKTILKEGVALRPA